ncbi:MAG: penicillin acylase family protein, partial [Bacteroidota bacterium]
MQVAVRRLILIAGLSVVSLLLLFLLSRPTGLMNYIAGTRVPPLGDVLDPDTGVLNAQGLTADSAVTIPDLTGEVRVIRDTRGVPHIYAGSERDAVMALGYVTAQDRLFQLDFFPRVASGRLAEAFGPDMVGTDQFLRSTGMEWGAKKNFEQIRSEGGPVLDLLQWFSDGVNAYIDGLSEDELPIEFRLSGYRPNRWSPLQSLRTIQVLTYDLSFDGDSYEYGWLKALMNDEEYEKLFPRNAPLYVPVIPGYPVPDLVPDSLRPRGDVRRPAPPRLRRVLPSLAPATTSAEPRAFFEEAGELLARHEAEREALQGTAFEGYIAGKGSNNWAVHRGRSETGAPILANDMHLALNLPAIWYEVHMVTPDYNTYGNVMPGMPLPVVAFNDHLAWGYTNGTVDVIDHYALELDATGTQYRYNDGYRPIVTEIDTIYVNGGDAVIDTLKYAHWGPVIDAGELGAVAIQWTAHKPMRNIEALRDMHLAKSMDEFQDALRNWDVAPQNVLAASRDGEIAIRTSGHFPIRAAGDGIGLLDGTTSDYEWTGRI